MFLRVVSDREAAALKNIARRARLEVLPASHVQAAAIAARRAAAYLAGEKSLGPSKLLRASKGEFTLGICGAKSINVAKLHSIAASSGGLFTVPPSVTLPFGTLEALLAQPQNADVAGTHKRSVTAAYVALDKAAVAGSPFSRLHIAGAAELRAARTAITDGLLPDNATVAALVEALKSVGEKAEALPALWRGVKLVWASKWNDRAVLSRRAQGVPDDLLNIAALIQVNRKGVDSLGRRIPLLHGALPVCVKPFSLNLLALLSPISSPSFPRATRLCSTRPTR